MGQPARQSLQVTVVGKEKQTARALALEASAQKQHTHSLTLHWAEQVMQPRLTSNGRGKAGLPSAQRREPGQV